MTNYQNDQYSFDPNERDEDIEVCYQCDYPIDDCICHKHDKYDEDRDREQEG